MPFCQLGDSNLEICLSDNLGLVSLIGSFYHLRNLSFAYGFRLILQIFERVIILDVLL